MEGHHITAAAAAEAAITALCDEISFPWEIIDDNDEYVDYGPPLCLFSLKFNVMLEVCGWIFCYDCDLDIISNFLMFQGSSGRCFRDKGSNLPVRYLLFWFSICLYRRFYHSYMQFFNSWAALP